MAKSAHNTILSPALKALLTAGSDTEIQPLCPRTGLPVYETLPHGCRVHTVRDDLHSPMFEPLDRVVIDPTDRDILYGELYAIEPAGRPELIQLCKAPDPNKIRLAVLNPHHQTDAADAIIHEKWVLRTIVGRVVGIIRTKGTSVPVAKEEVLT